jgi:hypothetical protein
VIVALNTPVLANVKSAVSTPVTPWLKVTCQLTGDPSVGVEVRRLIEVSEVPLSTIRGSSASIICHVRARLGRRFVDRVDGPDKAMRRRRNGERRIMVQSSAIGL